MRFLALAALSVALVSPALAQCENGQCQRLRRPGILNGACGDLSCPSRARILGAAPLRSFVQEVHPVRRLAGAVQRAQPVRRVVRRAAAAFQNRPRLLRRALGRVSGGCR